jgi:hypothetical protein
MDESRALQRHLPALDMALRYIAAPASEDAPPGKFAANVAGAAGIRGRFQT